MRVCIHMVTNSLPNELQSSRLFFKSPLDTVRSSKLSCPQPLNCGLEPLFLSSSRLLYYSALSFWGAKMFGLVV